ncbi:MAG: NAD(+) diphosphatase [Cellulosilyticum sp.]|nr:NAD(+) diphosphatase [Cellulosilyticum sp.]
MNDLEGYIDFWPEFEPDCEITGADLCFIYSAGQILVRKSEQIEIPCYKECEVLIQDSKDLWYLGTWCGKACFAYALEKKEELDLGSLEWIGFRDSRWNDAIECYQIVVKAQHLLNWDRSTKYCGCCGNLYQRKVDERAKKCPNCGHLQFPRISPAIIVGIKKDNQILMAHNSSFREGLYSVIAGFVEQGETLETAVKREIYEEVGIKVKNIRYFQSRPWTSIDSLMLGFIAEYESGEIKVDGKEIVDAMWCDKEHMPKVLPDRISTAWHIINEIIGLDECEV